MPESIRSRRRFTLASALLMVLVASSGWSPASSDALVPTTPALHAAAFRDVAFAPIRDRYENSARVAAAADFSGIGRLLASGGALLGVPQPVAKAKAPVAKAQVKTTVARVYSGTNHFWFPKLGISDPVRFYPCSRTRAPANYMYRWGCAGKNNVYILGHAYGVMKPLHDAYVSGRLRVGMVAVYANANGLVRKYRVTEWRVVRPTEVTWQIAAQRVPSMTLQTCVGKNSAYRLNVRLVVIR
jgi:hypothetical protein